MTDEPATDQVTDRATATPSGAAGGPGPREALSALARRLTDRGLHTAFVSDVLLLVLNPALPGGRASSTFRSPGLQQLVACRTDDSTKALWFWWVWSVTENHAPVEFGPLCAAADVDTAAERIAHVLAVHDEPPAPDA